MVFENASGKERISISSPYAISSVVMGSADDDSPEGIRVVTKGGVNLHAGGTLSLAAGTNTFDAGTGQTQNLMYTIQLSAAATLAALTFVSAQCGELAATGHIAKVAFVADLVGLAGGLTGTFWTHTNLYLSSPTKVAMIGGAETLVAAGAALDLTAVGAANLIAGAGVFIGTLGGITIVADKGNAEMISINKNVTIEAKKKGDVKIIAHGAISVKAEEKDIEVLAEKGAMYLQTKTGINVDSDGNGVVHFQKDLLIQSVKDKQIILGAGKSGLTMKDKKMLVEAEEFEIKTAGGKSSILMAKTGDITIKGAEIRVDGTKKLILKGKKVLQN